MQDMNRFSANLGFLWTDRPLALAIDAAARAGFDAVECHQPYDSPPTEIAGALEATGLAMIALNTRRGDADAGENGLAALAGRQVEAREAIDEAINYARAIGAGAVHVMAGCAQGDAALETYLGNLDFACSRAAPHGIAILIEALNGHDAPGYFLGTTEQARRIMLRLEHDNLRLMFDCYHVARSEGDVVGRLAALMPRIGHIQFAGVPHRGAPDQGDVDYVSVLKAARELGWRKPFGAEYRPDGDTDASLGWMRRLR